jgi:hypothetical protein
MTFFPQIEIGVKESSLYSVSKLVETLQDTEFQQTNQLLVTMYLHKQPVFMC